ncbi:hypothetical protein ACJJTC_005320 [Scirpophaga incertulas]
MSGRDGRMMTTGREGRTVTAGRQERVPTTGRDGRTVTSSRDGRTVTATDRDGRTVTTTTTRVRMRTSAGAGSAEPARQDRSFLDSTTKVTGVQDILTRMRNADIVIQEGDSADDAEARALLNKFLGATVLMAGMQGYVADPPRAAQVSQSLSCTCVAGLIRGSAVFIRSYTEGYGPSSTTCEDFIQNIARH